MSSSGTSDQNSGWNDAPSPFSRQGSDPNDELGADPQAAPPTAPPAAPNSWATYPTPEPVAPEPYGQPSAPNFDPQPTPPYAGSTTPYASNPYASNPYAANPYEVTPYQASYGGYGAYGVVPMIHPQAVPALVTGILGLAICPLVGIVGLVLGNKARKAIDAEPGRFTGRGQATAGFVLGIISIVYTVILVAFFAAGLSGALDY